MSYLDTFQLLSGPSGSTTDRSYGFDPGAIITFGSSATNTGDGASSSVNGRMSFGVSIGSANQCQAIFVQDADANSIDVAGESTAAAAAILTTPSAIDISWVPAFISGGARWTTIGTAAVVQRQHTLAIPASRIANSAVGTLTSPSGAGDVGVTVGFAADVVLFFYIIPSGSGSAALSVGAATRSGAIANVASRFNSNATGANSDANSYSRAGDSLLPFGLSARGSVTAWTATGFTTTFANGSADQFAYLALKAASGWAFDVAATNTRADSEQIILPFKNVRPDSGLFVSCCRAESSAGTASNNAAISLGAFAPAGTSTQVAMSVIAQHGVDPSQVGVAADYDSVYVNMTNPADTTLAGEMTLSSTGARHVALTMANADPSPSYFWALASGPAASRPRGAPIFF